jgi:hypothetical protein
MVDSSELFQSTETENNKVDTVDEIDDSLNVFDQQLQAEAETKLDSIKQQLALIEDIMKNNPEKKWEIQETIKKAKQEIANLKHDTNLSDTQKVSLEEYEKKSLELENFLKPWYEKTWDWVKEKSTNTFNYVKENPGKSLAFGATLGLGYLVYKRFTSDKKWDQNAHKNDSEKKPWYKKWWGIGLIWVAWFFGIKWLMDYFKKESDPLDSSAKQYKSYIDFMKENKEDYQQYELFWSTVNSFYDKAWELEKDNFGFQTDLEMWSIWNKVEKEKWYEHVETKGMVAYCLDNYYSNVDDLLSTGWVRSYLRDKSIEWYKQTIMAFWADWFNKTLVPYLSMFTSFASFGILSTDTAEQKMKKFFDWISDSAQDKKQQLDAFFRQYAKVLTYMADKKNALAIKYATPIIQTQWYNGETWPSDLEKQNELLLEAINDKDWVEKNLKWTNYGLFLNSKILWASKILKDELLLNPDITFELQEIIDELDQDSEDILWWLESNALFDAEATISSWWSLDQTTKNWLWKICDNLVEDIWDEESWSWAYNTFEYLFVALDLSEQDKQTIIQESWMKEAFDLIKKDIQWLKTEIITNPTKENIAKLKTLTWEYLAMKKEIHLAIYAMQEAKENKNFMDHVANVFNWFGILFKKFFQSISDIFSGNISLWSGINFFLGCIVTWTGLVIIWRVANKPLVTISWRAIQKVWLFPLYLTKAWLRRAGFGLAIQNRIIGLAKDWRVDKAQRLLYRWIANWHLSVDQAVRAWRVWGNRSPLVMWLNKTDNLDNFKILLSNIFPNGTQQVDIDIFAKYYNKNRKFASRLLDEKTTYIFSTRNREQQVKANTDMFTELKKLDDILNTINNASANKYFDSMFKKVRNVEDLKFMTDLSTNPQFVNKIWSDNLSIFSRLSLDEMRKLQSSWDLDLFVRWNKNLDDILSSLWKNKYIVRRTMETATNIDAATKTKFNSVIDEAIVSVRSQSSLNANFSKINEAKLSSLKNNKYLTELDMKSLVTLHWKWFRWSSLPDLFDVLKSDIPYNKWTGTLGDYLQDALKHWDYDSFAKALWDHKRSISIINIDDIIKQMDSVKVALRNADEFADILKWISRIIRFI